MDNSPFGKLSAEMRNEILKLVINSVQYESHGRVIKDIDLDADEITPPIARVCRQMRSDCLVMHFAGASVTVSILEDGRNRYCIDGCNKADGQSNAIEVLTAWLDLVARACHDVIACLELEMRINKDTFSQDWSSDEVLQPWIRLAATLQARGYHENRVLVRVYNTSYISRLNEYGIDYDGPNDDVAQVIEALRKVGIPANDWEPWV